jgi:hypothetical protein
MIVTGNTHRLAMIFSAALVLLATPAFLVAGPRDPFPIGYCMMSQGAIVEAEGVSGRQPWTSAAFYRDTLRWGASAAAVSYHGGGSASQYAAGGFGTLGPVVGKASIMQLDVMRIYYEQTFSASVGSAWRSLAFALDAQAYRTGLYGRSSETRTMAAVGAALHVQSNRISADVTAQGLTVRSSGSPEADPAPYFTARVCTVRNKYGSQGAIIKVTPGDDAPVRFVLAQEYRIGKMFALSASIASNPTTIGFGIAIDKSPLSAAAAVVNHPFLGWSGGMSVDYAR